MDEAVVADVDADVREGAPQGIEEDQVAGPQLVPADGDEARRGGLVVDLARQDQPEARLEDMAREAAAVEAAVRRRAAGA
jgi:hypothetical protein